MKDPNKKALRSIYKEKLLALSDTQKEKASLLICERLQGVPVIKKARHLGCFAARSNEPDLKSLLLKKEGKKIGFPRVDLKIDRMSFFSVEEKDELVTGSFGIAEPTSGEEMNFESGDVILIPGLTFDTEGGRLGSGKGFYDRFLEKRAQVFLIGVSFELQIHSSPLPQESHDRKMNFIVTESRIIKISQ